MQAAHDTVEVRPYAEEQPRLDWDIDRDVIRGRRVDPGRKYLPDGLSLVDCLDFLDRDQRLLLGQVQGRTYARMFGLLEHFIVAKNFDLRRRYAPTDRLALQALDRFTEQELKHRELFRRLDRLVAAEMPPGYRFLARHDDMAAFALEKANWAALALIHEVGRLAQVHYRHSIESDPQLSDLHKDVFFFHWREELQHALLEEREWLREDAKLGAPERDRAVDDLIELFQGVDAVLLFQAQADVEYFAGLCQGGFAPGDIDRLHAGVLAAYRWQYLGCGIDDARFSALLSGMLDWGQMARFRSELPLILP